MFTTRRSNIRSTSSIKSFSNPHECISLFLCGIHVPVRFRHLAMHLTFPYLIFLEILLRSVFECVIVFRDTNFFCQSISWLWWVQATSESSEHSPKTRIFFSRCCRGKWEKQVQTLGSWRRTYSSTRSSIPSYLGPKQTLANWHPQCLWSIRISVWPVPGQDHFLDSICDAENTCDDNQASPGLRICNSTTGIVLVP